MPGSLSQQRVTSNFWLGLAWLGRIAKSTTRHIQLLAWLGLAWLGRIYSDVAFLSFFLCLCIRALAA
ncbi:MAG: hypothetical protein EOS05_33355 [Mesorhizobium sp.]|nr:MAG: hypothetical protein EOS05_33355 [Mesorhizobium sp.]